MISWPYLAIRNKAVKHLSDKEGWMDVSAIKEKQLFIAVVLFFPMILLECTGCASLRECAVTP